MPCVRIYWYCVLLAAACAGCGPNEIPAYKAGDTVNGGSFQITLHGVTRESRIALDGSLDPVADATEQFIVIEATVKNTGNAARTFTAGKLNAAVDGKPLAFDRETVASADYANVEKIAPLSSVRRKVAFRVPRQASPPFTWTPGPSDVRIQLAEAVSVSKRVGAGVDQPAVLPRLEISTVSTEAPAVAPDVALAYQMPYAEARRVLIASGWRPARNPQPERLESGGKMLFQDGVVEVQGCAETGVANCKFAWNRASDDQPLVVFTEGKRPRVFGWSAE
jgi:hypothetical protein